MERAPTFLLDIPKVYRSIKRCQKVDSRALKLREEWLAWK